MQHRLKLSLTHMDTVLHVYGLLELQSVTVETFRIFCTFYIECTETALVLQNATLWLFWITKS